MMPAARLEREYRLLKAIRVLITRHATHTGARNAAISHDNDAVSVAQAATDRRVGHLSYWLGTAFQGKGYMTEAVRHAIAAGFRYLELERTEAGAHPETSIPLP